MTEAACPRLVPLDAEHLPTRVRWLSDARVREGITIGFVPTLPDTQEWFSARNPATRWDGVMLDADGRPVAMCGLTVTATGEADLYLYVDPDRHRQGWGRATLAALLTQAEHLGLEGVSLTVDAGNGPARALYRQCGFIDAGHEPDRPDRLRLTRWVR